jgi:hypothetical protein
MSMILSGSDDQFHRYLFEYRHDGSEYGIVIDARSPAEAKERLNALNFARYCGEVQATIHVPNVGGFLGRSIRRWFRS